MSSTSFEPGSHILLESGRVFRGTLYFDEDDVGTAADPITVGSYGDGRALLDGGDGYGIVVRNTGGFRIENLIIRGSGIQRNLGSGIAIENDRPGNVKLEHIHLSGIEVSGFGYHGIVIDGKNGKSGFRHVQIIRIDAHDNALSGITVQGWWQDTPVAYAHEDIYIARSAAHHNSGLPGRKRPHSGSGIVMSDVNRGVVEHSTAYGNGGLCDSDEGGPVGIWAWDSNDLVIQFNVSCHNRTAGEYDGGGFDLDGCVSNSIVQYNVSYENDGAGFMLMHFSAGRRHVNNALRYNVSLNDGRRNGYAGIRLWGEIAESTVHGNSVFVDPSRDSQPSALEVSSTRRGRADEVGTNTRIWRNLFQTDGGTWLVRVEAKHPGLLFEQNTYLAPSGQFLIDWQGVTCRSPAEWRSVAPTRDGILDGDCRATWACYGAPTDRSRVEGWLADHPVHEGAACGGADLDIRRLFGVTSAAVQEHDWTVGRY